MASVEPHCGSDFSVMARMRSRRLRSGEIRKLALWLIELAKISQIDGADLSAPDKANSADFACATKALLSLDYQKLGRGGTPPRFGDRKPYKVVVYYLH